MTKYILQQSSERVVQVSSNSPSIYENPIRLREYIDIVSNSRALVIAVILSVTFLGVCYAYLKAPLFESSMLIQVAENRTPYLRLISGDSTTVTDVKITAVSEIELLRSRSVIGGAISNLGLYFEAKPKYFFLFGAQVAAYTNGLISRLNLGGLGGYCWGGEHIKVSLFNVPDSFLDVRFRITKGSGSQFRLTEGTKNIDVWGQIGVTKRLKIENDFIEFRIDEIIAEPGAQFGLVRRPKESVIDDVQKTFFVSELGKQSNMISASLKGSDAKSVRNLLAEIASEYFRQNQALRRNEIEKSLNLFDEKLPDLKSRLLLSEQKYNASRKRYGVSNFNEDASIRLRLYSTGQERLGELERKRRELRVRFGDAHPVLIGIDDQIKVVVNENAKMASQIKQLPAIEQELGQLAREVKVNTDMYTSILRNSQELRLALSEKSNDIRLVDLPGMPVSSIDSRKKIIVFSMALALILGLLSAFLKKLLSD